MKKVKSRRSGLRIMAKLITLLGSFAYVMVLAIINGTLGNLFSIGVTFFGSVGIAKLLGEFGYANPINISWLVLIILIIGCGILRGILRYFEQYANHYIAFKILAILRDKIFAKLRVLAPAKLDDKQKGSIISMITSDIETLEVFYAHTISPVCIATLVSLTIVLTIGFIVSWYLAIVALVAYIFIGIILPIISSKTMKDTGVRYRNKFSSFNSFFLDSILGIKDIVLNNASKRRETEVNNRSIALLDETKKLKNKTALSSALTELFVTIFILLGISIGVVLVIYDDLDIGRLVIGIVAIMSSFGPVIAISALPGNLNQTFASGERVLSLLEEEPLVKEITDGKNIDFESLEVKNLSFEYLKNNEVLHGISLKTKENEAIGIVGESGCGKSTLLKLLLRFYKCEEGEILYNDINIENINSKSLLDNVTLVSQETYLFNDTIENNIRLAKLDATKEEIIEAAKQASIHDFIMSLPEGYNSNVGLMGDYLSAGEKQRIGLARAFLKGSKLILLDEPTSNVDYINEGIILSSLINQKNKKSIILVSHRQSTMSIVDKTYSIQDGHIKEV